MPVAATAYEMFAPRKGTARNWALHLHEAPDGAVVGFVQMYPGFSSLRAARTFVLYDLARRLYDRATAVAAASRETPWTAFSPLMNRLRAEFNRIALAAVGKFVGERRSPYSHSNAAAARHQPDDQQQRHSR